MRALLKTAKKSAQKSILLALFVLFGVLAFGEAQAANPLELNFWLNGPRYDGRVAPCESARTKPSIRSSGACAPRFYKSQSVQFDQNASELVHQGILWAFGTSKPDPK